MYARIGGIKAAGICAALCCLYGAAVTSAAQSRAAYVTWQGAEPDKGASMWLIVRHIDPHARILVVPFEAPLPSGIPFDVPVARYRRTHHASTFESLLRYHPVADPIVQRMAQIIHDIEINLWRPRRFPESIVIENTTLEIAERFGGRNIPVTCFVPLFDGIYSWLASGQTERTLIVPRECRKENAGDR